MLSSLLVLVLAVVAPAVHANVFVSNFYSLTSINSTFSSKVTEPTASTTWAAGQPVTITWQDDGNTPNLTAFGPCTIGLYAGSQTQQVCSMRLPLDSLILIIHRHCCN